MPFKRRAPRFLPRRLPSSAIPRLRLVCHSALVSPLASPRPLTARLIDSLYVEAMLLADELRTYFDERGRADRERLPPSARVSFSCESLKATTRLMHVVAWLLIRRAVETGELDPVHARGVGRRLGNVPESEPHIVAGLPEAARVLIAASCDLHARVHRLDAETAPPAPSPARLLIERLERAF
jgi:regulator of CtrA degradation